MGLRRNRASIYLVVYLIVLNLLCSNLDATSEVKVLHIFIRRQLATVPVPAPAPVPVPGGTIPAPSRNLSPPAPKPLSDSTPKPNKDKKDSNIKNTVVPIVILVVLCALLVSCICLCCYKCKKIRNVERDEHPLLHLNFAGSPLRSYAPSPIDINKLGALPLNGSRLNGPRLNGSQLTGSPLRSHAPSPIDINKPRPLHGPRLNRSQIPDNRPVTPKATPPPPPPPQPTTNKPPPPPPLPIKKPGPPPPPPLKNPGPPPPPPPGKKPGPGPPPPPGKKSGPGHSVGPGPSKGGADLDAAGGRKKLKPFFWDKMMMGGGDTDQSMVWDHLKSGSFQFSEEMIESLFGMTSDKGKNEKKDSGLNEKTPQYVKLLDPKKSQNLAISLKAKNIKVEHVIEALNEGNELPKELIETLIKMRPSQDEEIKLRLYNGDNCLLGPAEQFYKVLIEIPFVFERLNAFVFMSTFHEESSSIRRDFDTLEVACEELKSSRLFLKLLEAVLKLGNRMNSGTFRGGAKAFKLDTLLKLSDVKGTDNRTTLLHFVVQQIVKSEGQRQNPNPNYSPRSPNFSPRNPNYPPQSPNYSPRNPNYSPRNPNNSPRNPNPSNSFNDEEEENYNFTLGLEVVSRIGDEMENVRKAAGLDIDLITNNVASLGTKLVEIKKFHDKFVKSIEGESGFKNILECFVQNATKEAEYLIEREKKVRGVVRNTIDYFHGTDGKDEGLRLFVIVRDFLGILDRVCKEVRASASKTVQRRRVGEGSGNGSGSGSGSGFSVPDPRQYLFPAIRDRRVDSSSSDEED